MGGGPVTRIAPFAADRVRELYGDVETYRSTFKRAVESLVADGRVAAEEATTSIQLVSDSGGKRP